MLQCNVKEDRNRGREGGRKAEVREIDNLILFTTWETLQWLRLSCS